MRFNFFYDAGHGWLQVPMPIAADVGMYEGDFTAYSYVEGDVLYLEEDCDALTFVRAWEAKHGTILTNAIDHGDWSAIRNMARVRARAYDDEISF